MTTAAALPAVGEPVFAWSIPDGRFEHVGNATANGAFPAGATHRLIDSADWTAAIVQASPLVIAARAAFFADSANFAPIGSGNNTQVGIFSGDIGPMEYTGASGTYTATAAAATTFATTRLALVAGNRTARAAFLSEANIDVNFVPQEGGNFRATQADGGIVGGTAQGRALLIQLNGAEWAFHNTMIGQTSANINASNFTNIQTAATLGTPGNHHGPRILQFETDDNYLTHQSYQQNPLPTFGVNVPNGSVLRGFRLTVLNNSVAILEINDDTPIQALNYVVVPLVMRMTGATATVTVRSGSGEQVIAVPNAGEGLGAGTTTNIVGDVVNSARGRIYVPAITITENRANVLQSGWFALIPPEGFNLVRALGGNFAPIAGWDAANGHGDWRTNQAIFNRVSSFTFTEGTVGAGQTRTQVGQAVQLTVPAGGGGARTTAGVVTIPANTFALQPIEQAETQWFGGETVNLRIVNWNTLRYRTDATEVATEAGTRWNPHRGTWNPGLITPANFANTTIDGMDRDPIPAFAEGTLVAGTPTGWFNGIVESWGVGTRAVVTRGHVDSIVANVTISTPTHVIHGRNAGDTGWAVGAANTGHVLQTGGNPGITAATFAVGIRDQWDATWTAATATNVWAGRAGQLAARATLESTTVNAWNVTRDTVFTLVDEAGNELIDRVRITNVTVAGGADAPRDVRSIAAGAGVPGGPFINAAATGTTQPIWYAHALFGREGHQFILRDLAFPQGIGNHRPRVSLDFQLSVSPDFGSLEGERIFLRVEGGGFEDQFNRVNLSNTQVHIATAFLPFSVETETTTVQIGHLIYEVADIAITENIVEGFGRGFGVGTTLEIGVGAFGRTAIRAGGYMGFNPITRANISTTSEQNSLQVADARVNQGGTILVSVAAAARGATPSVITLRDLSLDIDRTVPHGSYDLIIGMSGTGIVNNSTGGDANVLWLFDRFPVDGRTAFTNYIQMGTAGAARPFINEVRIRPSEYVAFVNDRPFDMDAPPLFFGNRVYVPVRFISHVLGVEESNVRWDPLLNQVVIETAERQIIFREGYSTYWVNGMAHGMWNTDDWGNIVPAYPRRPDEMQVMQHPSAWQRLYIPVRFIAYAFGIASEEIDFVGGEVIFNPTNINIQVPYDLYNGQ
jgi:hypothetical protein